MARAGGVKVALPLFQVERDGSIPISALYFEDCTRPFFRAMNVKWHRTLPNIGAINTMKACFMARANGDCYAVAAWSNPVARCLPQRAWLELRRFAIADDAPRNTASKMLGWMVRELRRRHSSIEKLISYQDCSEHEGTIYAASNWAPVKVATPGKWNNRKRWNRKAGHIKKKIRWEFEL